MKMIILLVLGAACSSHPGVLTEKAKSLEVYSNKPASCNVYWAKWTGSNFSIGTVISGGVATSRNLKF